MRKFMPWVGAGAAVVAFVLVGGIRANEAKVALDKLPKPVLEAVKAKFPEAKLVRAEKEKEEGKTQYEVTILSKGQSMQVIVTPEGAVVQVEKKIAATDLPQAVAKALEDKYPKASIKKVEEISKEDKVTAYEALIETADAKTLEVTFDPSGKFLEEEKKDKK
jgi:putative PepSY-like beta-lactamase-inhibitor